MKDKCFLFCVFIMICCSVQNIQAASFFNEENININGKFTDNLFASGGSINADFISTDDIFMMGGDIHSIVETTSNLFLLGGSLYTGDSRADLATLIGGSLRVVKSRFRELILLGGNVLLDDSLILDDFLAAAGNVKVGPKVHVMGTTIITGKVVTLMGRFTRDVHIYAEELHIMAGTMIEENLRHYVKKIVIDPSAQIMGDIIVIEPTEKELESWKGWSVLVALLFFITSLLIAPTIVYFFPQLMENGSEIFQSNSWQVIGKGSLITLLIPIFIILFFISIIGIPFGLALIPLILTAVIISSSIVSFITGNYLRSKLLKKENLEHSAMKVQMGWTFLGALALTILQALPLIGILFHLFIIFLGFGILSFLRSTDKRSGRF